MNATLAAYPDCGDEYAETLARAAGRIARDEGWDLSPWDLLEMASTLIPGRHEVVPSGVTLSKVLDHYIALRKRDGLGHASAIEAIRQAIEGTMLVPV